MRFVPLGFLSLLQTFHHQRMPLTHHTVCVVDRIHPLCIHLFNVVEPLSRPPIPQSLIVPCLQDVLVFMSVYILRCMKSMYLALHSDIVLPWCTLWGPNIQVP